MVCTKMLLRWVCLFVLCNSLLPANIAGIPVPITNLPTTQATTVKTVRLNPDQIKCPAFPLAEECPDELDHECSDDKECAKLNNEWETYKCCMDGCERRCVRTYIKKQISDDQFKCPVFPPAEECPDELDHECNDDKDCAKLNNEMDTYKCCIDGCEKRCVPAVPVPFTNLPTTQATTVKTVRFKADQFKCPVFPQAAECPAESDHECSDDKDCVKLNNGMETYKCCLDGCDRICVPGYPVPFFTNLPTTQATKVETVGINTDQFKCPVFPPAEECPDKDDLSHDCNVDKDCVNFNNEKDTTYKCCLDGCERQCVPGIPVPITNLPTTQATTVKTVGINTGQFKCPVFPPGEGCPADEDDLDHECSDDKDCVNYNDEMDTTYKCCLDGCARQCVPGIPVPITNLPTTQATTVKKTDSMESNPWMKLKLKLLVNVKTGNVTLVR